MDALLMKCNCDHRVHVVELFRDFRMNVSYIFCELIMIFCLCLFSSCLVVLTFSLVVLFVLLIDFK